MRWILSTILLITITALATGEPAYITARNPVNDFMKWRLLNEKLQRVLLERKAVQFELGRSKEGRAVEAWFFPGRSNKNALVIGGVHGSELSSIEVAYTLVDQLAKGDSIYYNVIIVPSLFPDNAAIARSRKKEIGSPRNIGRYSFTGAPDPNRQMPSPGSALDETGKSDHAGRKLEDENLLLLQLIEVYRPQRIASVHAIRDKNYSGFFADPRTDERGIALGYDTDSSLAVMMAGYVYQLGGPVPGNQLTRRPTALYYKDPSPAPKGNFQPRNFTGSPMPGYKSAGVSLGTWASTAIRDTLEPSRSREAIRIITIEFPGSKRPGDYGNMAQREQCSKQVKRFADAIRLVFLQEYFVEERAAPTAAL